MRMNAVAEADKEWDEFDSKLHGIHAFVVSPDGERVENTMESAKEEFRIGFYAALKERPLPDDAPFAIRIGYACFPVIGQNKHKLESILETIRL